jgi:hypothetical protein
MKRFPKALKWIGVILGAVIVLLLLLNALFGWSTAIRLERKLAALRQAGDPVQLSDLARVPLPPDKNANDYLRRAAGDLDAIQKDLAAWYPKTGYPSSSEKLAPADQERLEKLFAPHPNLIKLLEQSAECRESDPELDCTLPTTGFLNPYMDHVSRHRILNRVLRARATWLLSSGRSDDALATHVLLLQLTRHWRREPMIMGFLVTAVCEQGAMYGANEVLQSGTVSLSARAALDAELAQHDTMEGYDWALRSERSYSLSSVRELRVSGVWLTRGFTNDLMLEMLKLYDRLLQNGARDYADVISDRTSLPTSGFRLNPYLTLAKLLEPGLNAIREPAERTRAMARCLRVLNALQARVPVAGDSVPRLADLGLPGATTIDPYNGEPLHVKKLTEGWVVYSVGKNLADDGGKPDWKTDIGAGPLLPQELPQRR